jgi:NADH:ubiquinone oxidoreductase subunit 2 (subunit N)
MFLVSATWSCCCRPTTSAEGDYWESEYYSLLVSIAILGMLVMASARDLLVDLRGARAAVDPGLHARRLAQARR